jgi:hypothetical protein
VQAQVQAQMQAQIQAQMQMQAQAQLQSHTHARQMQAQAQLQAQAAQAAAAGAQTQPTATDTNAMMPLQNDLAGAPQAQVGGRDTSSCDSASDNKQQLEQQWQHVAADTSAVGATLPAARTKTIKDENDSAS